ncbi:hypothetical protein PbDSM24746_55390 [Paenibacillus macerans]|nr:hypothetical protein PbDSM24746_55390 [Paenibacillus macerans]GBK72245.1 hypothetical protein PbJCM17693_59530 [Paenibacillus macerans]
MVEFEAVHKEWLKAHMKLRSGERKARLERGHGHGEECFGVMCGGRCGGTWTACIRNMKLWIGGADLILPILHG